jgi:membrane associated rhomboid family serine protease
MPLPVRWRYKLDRWRNNIRERFRSRPRAQPRPRLCPACGTLVGATATRCHQCGASMTFSLAAANRSLSKLLPHATPITYIILAFTSTVYVVSLLATMRRTGFAAPQGGLMGMIFGLGGINNVILIRMGASLPQGFNLEQPWRLVTAIFLHGSLLHIGFNMWALMSVAPIVEEIYGSGRFLFIYIVTGAFGYVLSSAVGNNSVGASGALVGLIGVLLAMTMGRQNAGLRMLRSQLISWLVYLALMGFMMRGMIDNFAHGGGLVAGFALGKLMVDRKPADNVERRRAEILGWAAALSIVVSFTFMLFYYFSQSGPFG